MSYIFFCVVDVSFARFYCCFVSFPTAYIFYLVFLFYVVLPSFSAISFRFVIGIGAVLVIAVVVIIVEVR